MALETATYLHQLNSANPSGSDRLQQGDDHIRLIKAALKATFPNLTGAVTLNQDSLNLLPGLVVPAGLIAPFFGDTAPAGWAICNGQIVPRSDGSGNITTPDLRGRAIVGASSDFAINQPHGQRSKTVTSEVGGAHGHTASASPSGAHDHGGSTGSTALSIAQMPAHSHGSGIADNNNSMWVYGNKPGSSASNPAADSSNGTSQGITETIGGGEGHAHGITAAPAHNHDIAVSSQSGHAHQVTVDVVQPSYALHWIMKV